MRKTVGAVFTLALAMGLLAAPAPASAQQDPNNIIIESIELDQAEIRDALKVLFRSTSLNYTVAPDVQGVVTVSLKDVPFKTALRGILTQVDATWREEGNIFNIIRRPDPVVPTTTPGTDFGTQDSGETRFFYVPLNDPAMILGILLDQLSVESNPETSSGVGLTQGGGGFGGGGFGGGGFGGGGFGGGGFGGGGFGGGGFGGGGFGGGGLGGFGGGGLGGFGGGGIGGR